jgi:hypothetical protein
MPIFTRRGHVSSLEMPKNARVTHSAKVNRGIMLVSTARHGPKAREISHESEVAMSTRPKKPSKTGSRPKHQIPFVKVWASKAFLVVIAVALLPTVLSFLYIAVYKPSPAWVQMSTPYAWGAGAVTAAATFVVVVHMLRQDRKLDAGRAISWHEKAYSLFLAIGIPAAMAFLMMQALVTGFPMLLTALVAAPVALEYTFYSSDLGSRGCSPMIAVEETNDKICGFSAPPSWRAGDTISVTGSGSFLGVFVEAIDWVRPATSP